MKNCNTCLKPHERPKADRCLICERTHARKLYEERNKEKIKERQRIYREKNKEKLKEIRKRSYYKYREKYKQKALESFIKKKGLPADYQRWKKRSGEGNISKDGYKIITCPEKDHPNRYDSKGRIAEHVYIMTKYIGRPLKKGEAVHHINGIRDDNRIENLELWHRSHPPGQRVEDKIQWCKEFLEIYGYKVSEQ